MSLRKIGVGFFEILFVIKSQLMNIHTHLALRQENSTNYKTGKIKPIKRISCEFF